MPGPDEKPKNAFAEPRRAVSAPPTVFDRLSQQAGYAWNDFADAQYKRSPQYRAIRWKAMEEARKRAEAEAIAKAKSTIRPRYANPFPVTDESIETERQADELLRIKQERRNAFSTKPKG